MTERFDFDPVAATDLGYEGIVEACSANLAETAVEDPIILAAAEHMLSVSDSTKTRRDEGEAYFVRMLRERGYISPDSRVAAAVAVSGIAAACKRKIESGN